MHALLCLLFDKVTKHQSTCKEVFYTAVFYYRGGDMAWVGGPATSPPWISTPLLLTTGIATPPIAYLALTSPMLTHDIMTPPIAEHTWREYLPWPVL